MKTINDIENLQNEINEEISNMEKLISIKKQQVALLEEEKNLLNINQDKENRSLYYLHSNRDFQEQKSLQEDYLNDLSLFELLKVSNVLITYEKQNGDVVKRTITVQEDVIKDYVTITKGEKKRDINSKTFYAFDVRKKMFKKFITENVINFEPSL